MTLLIGLITNLNTMAFNLATFTTRALTATVFALIMLTGLFWNGWSFIILFTIIHFGCWYDFLKLAKKINPHRPTYFFLTGLFYITLPITLMLMLGFPYQQLFSGYGGQNTWQYSFIIPCAIIFSVWINDTMAYLVGSLIGRTPFSSISPKKTWEGTVGGALSCIFFITILGWRSNLFSVYNWIVIGLITAVFGTLGDLLESRLKRLAEVKDSGSLMPGHGGFLDRFDSLLIATPFVWLYVYLFM